MMTSLHTNSTQTCLPRVSSVSSLYVFTLKCHLRILKDSYLFLFQTTRKASTAYYPTLHLEIARYVSIADASGFEVPWSLARYIGLPPTNVLKAGTLDRMAGTARGARITVTGGQTPPGSPSRQSQAPRGIQLPQIKPVSPMK